MLNQNSNNGRGVPPITAEQLARGLTKEEKFIAACYANGVTDPKKIQTYYSYYELAVGQDVMYGSMRYQVKSDGVSVPGRPRIKVK